MKKALLLNATYEPLCVVPLRRAIVLVLAQRADIIEEGDGLFNSVSTSIPVPSVIKLRYFVKVPYRSSFPATRRGVLTRDRYRCQYCPNKADTIDHVMPRSRGGAHSWENLAAACRSCNQKKDNRTPKEAGMKLRREPKPPSGKGSLVLVIGELEDTWAQYLDPQLVGA